MFSCELLIRADHEAKLPSEREHVTPWFRSDRADLRWGHFCHEPIRPYFRVTVDEFVDLEVVRTIVKALAPKDPLLGIDSIVDYLKANPEVSSRNISIIRNEGYLKSLEDDLNHTLRKSSGKGQKLWERAKRVIPGGNMLL